MIDKIKPAACELLYYATFKKVCFGKCEYCKL